MLDTQFNHQSTKGFVCCHWAMYGSGLCFAFSHLQSFFSEFELLKTCQFTMPPQHVSHSVSWILSYFSICRDAQVQCQKRSRPGLIAAQCLFASTVQTSAARANCFIASKLVAATLLGGNTLATASIMGKGKDINMEKLLGQSWNGSCPVFLDLHVNVLPALAWSFCLGC